jgi:hypothetical protein
MRRRRFRPQARIVFTSCDPGTELYDEQMVMDIRQLTHEPATIGAFYSWDGKIAYRAWHETDSAKAAEHKRLCVRTPFAPRWSSLS